MASTSPVTRSANRLSDSTSPYLLQHAHNPVDWYPFSSEAIDKARAEGKPIFLSIGYSACHWCHVMEREVFENEQIAALMNQHFVNIKVDREERPDLDELYMLATQVLSGSGGWPMSVWLTPDLLPFYAGTYFPPTDAYGRPGFPRIIQAIADMWANRRATLLEQAQKVVDAVRHHADETERQGAGQKIELDRALIEAVEQFADRFDSEFGGLGTAPKFPPHQSLALWLALLRHPGPLEPSHLAALREMVTKTLDAMMAGGIFDQLAGGFARYSTDALWLVPHFEKMLYDNAQLAPVYAAAAHQFGRADYARAARRTLDFCLHEMMSPEGAFYSAFDADSEGIEGKYYVWTLAQIREAIPDAAEAQLLIDHLGITEQGNWHEGDHAWGAGANVLHSERSADDLAKQHGVTVEVMSKRLADLTRRLLEVRARRTPPTLDDKVLTSWNGLMISALARSGRLLREPRYLEAAHRAVGFILLHHMDRGRHLLRVSRRRPDGQIHAHTAAFLEDHAFLLNGIMDLIDATQPTSLPGTMARKRALELADTMVREFADTEHGGFFFTRQDGLFARLKNIADGAVPNANAMAIHALLRLAQVSGKEEYRDLAQRAAQAFSAILGRGPSLVPTLLHALHCDREFLASNPHLNVPAAPPSVEVGVPLPAEQQHEPPEIIAPLESVAAPAAVFHIDPVALPPVRPGETFDLNLVLHIAEGYHVQPAHPQDREAFATVARIRGDLPVAAQEWFYPEPERLAETHPPLRGYHGAITITGRLTVQHNAAAGAYSLRAIILAQPCSGTSCLPPEKAALDIPVRVIP